MYEYIIIELYNIGDMNDLSNQWWEVVQIFDKLPRKVLMKRKVWLFKRLLKKLKH